MGKGFLGDGTDAVADAMELQFKCEIATKTTLLGEQPRRWRRSYVSASISIPVSRRHSHFPDGAALDVGQAGVRHFDLCDMTFDFVPN